MTEYEICSTRDAFGTEVLQTIEAESQEHAEVIAEGLNYLGDDIWVRPKRGSKRKPIYAVIRVDQCYDCVEGAECLASFPTAEEAEKHIQEIKAERDRLYKEKREYIDRFVEAIELPKTDYYGWVKFLKQYSFFGDRYVLPQDFKSTMKSYLSEQNPPLAGFAPPPVKHGLNNLFVVVV